MKTSIKTAHGYLSFQPPDPNDPQQTVPPMQYRPGCGVWEEIDLPGLDALLPPPSPEAPETPETPPPQSNWPPFDLTPSESSAYVGQIKQALIDAGTDLSGPCGAFEVVKQVAWGLQFQRHCGLLSKPDGNNCQGYSTDVVCYPDGSLADILGDAGGENVPQWSYPSDMVDPARWRPPIEP